MRPETAGVALLGGRERLLVVGLLPDLGHELAIDDPVVLVEDHHGAGGDPSERAVLDEHAVVLREVLPAHERERHHITTFWSPSVVQKRFEANGRSADTTSTTVFASFPAASLNLRVEVAHTSVSRLGTMFRIFLLPR